VPQAENFQTEWVANLVRETNQFQLLGPLGVVTTTPLYNAPGVARKIAAAFDAASSPAIAWELDGVTTVAWTASSVIQRLSFAGYSPVMFNTFAIDSTVTAGTATLAVFYLKPQDSTIYCRIIAESFATERRYCNSPVAALYLQQARRYEGRLEIVGIDTGHRLARWRSEGYLTPPEIQVVNAIIEDFSGELMEVTVRRQWEDSVGAELVGIEGSVMEIRIPAAAADTMGMAYVETTISGTLTEIRIPANAEDSVIAVVIDNQMTGAYTQVAMQGQAESGPVASVFESITGSYG
jgi:hypothetical protein